LRIALILSLALAGLRLRNPGQRTPQVDLVPSAQPVRYAQQASPWPRPPSPSQPSGSLFQAASYRPAFEDPRARMIRRHRSRSQITENASARRRSRPRRRQDQHRQRVGRCLRAALHQPPAASLLRKLDVGAKSSNKFAGNGEHRERQHLPPAPSRPRCIDVQPNGHLLVTGEKQIGVNQNVDVLRFSGTVDPETDPPAATWSPPPRWPTCASSRAGAAQQGEAQVNWRGWHASS
jgi:flagellar L-ring protein precursor FlgH